LMGVPKKPVFLTLALALVVVALALAGAGVGVGEEIGAETGPGTRGGRGAAAGSEVASWRMSIALSSSASGPSLSSLACWYSIAYSISWRNANGIDGMLVLGNSSGKVDEW